MRAYILAQHTTHGFPSVLLPEEGRSIVNYVLDEVLLQKQIDGITIVVNVQTKPLVQKHLHSSYPQLEYAFENNMPSDPNEHIVLEGAVHTSLRLQDLIRYYQQFKTVTASAYNKVRPYPIPFTVYPQEKRRSLQSHTYNCGTCLYKTTISASL